MNWLYLALAWGFYWWGAGWYELTDRRPFNRWEWTYRVYSNLMSLADYWQGDLEGGPWQTVEPPVTGKE